MKGNNNSKIDSIKNKNILKKILSNLKMFQVLRLIKYNKNLQAGLNINEEVFESYSDFPKLDIDKKVDITKEVNIRRNYGNAKYRRKDKNFCFSSCCFSVYFLYLFIYTILLVSLDSFDESNTEDNSENSINVINSINKWLFALVAITIIYYIYLIFYILKITSKDMDLRRNIKLITMLIFIVIYIIFEILIIVKLAMSYAIKSGSAKWFMNMDVFFIIFNLIYILFTICQLYCYHKKTIPKITTKTSFTLKSISDIKIQNYILPLNFDTFNKKDQKKYILVNLGEIYPEQKNISIRNIPLISELNSQRSKYNLSALGCLDQKKSVLRSFMFLLPSEAFFFSSKYIFRLGRNKYLIKCPFDEFNRRLKTANQTLINIIKIKELNNIFINERITDKINVYIYIWEDKLEFDNDKMTSFGKSKKSKGNNKNKKEKQDSKINIGMENDLEENLL
jgi:hypothetical protein